ncbi:NADH dehydrogenase [ubiquinone] 1 alpha subcomplex subunit 3 [Myotis brandtii]|uniref:NADH dehydrogenase [ubiquinone] 1 alpha subcomplex subunit 3 n=1 Tax=Myotis brandtii TaxID=109478 RepID=S7PZ26_MYOBR|nr:NADH dehydrogenase [ubiquinone] 1 alpha subcomplex subunit 3 [Myotis brandtii]
MSRLREKRGRRQVCKTGLPLNEERRFLSCRDFCSAPVRTRGIQGSLGTGTTTPRVLRALAAALDRRSAPVRTRRLRPPRLGSRDYNTQGAPRPRRRRDQDGRDPFTKYATMINKVTPYNYPVPVRDDGNMPDVPSHPQDPQGQNLEWLKKL